MLGSAVSCILRFWETNLKTGVRSIGYKFYRGLMLVQDTFDDGKASACSLSDWLCCKKWLKQFLFYLRTNLDVAG